MNISFSRALVNKKIKFISIDLIDFNMHICEYEYIMTCGTLII